MFEDPTLLIIIALLGFVGTILWGVPVIFKTPTGPWVPGLASGGIPAVVDPTPSFEKVAYYAVALAVGDTLGLMVLFVVVVLRVWLMRGNQSHRI